MADIETITTELLSNASGVLHLGAHYGQEAAQYAAFGLPVVWVEADPKAHRKL